MFRQLRRNLVATLIVALTISRVMSALTDTANILPDMGALTGSTPSIGQEMQMGSYYTHQLHGSAPSINDPLLTQYINTLGICLVLHTDSVKTPFVFLLINNDKVSTFVFFDGNAVLYSVLFRYSSDESQLAPVMAHEISHITQHHLAHAMEDQKRSVPLTWIGTLGSILLAMASSQAGMAALTDTLMGTCQGMISFAQQNEQEADRIGIQVLRRSGFDPWAMPTLLEKLLNQTRYSSRPPEILPTHPLPESRLSDVCNRVNQMRSVVVQPSEGFYLAKVRTLGTYNSGRNQLTGDLLSSWSKGNTRGQRAAQYSRALQAIEANRHNEARKTLQPLLAADSNNIWYLDLVTDIDLGQKKTSNATNRLKNARDLRTNPVLQPDLVNVYSQGGQAKEAVTILNHYTFSHKDDLNGWDLSAQTEANLSNRDQELTMCVEGYVLAGRLDQAIPTLSSASSQVKLDSQQQARYDVRIDQLRQLQKRFKPYTKMQLSNPRRMVTLQHFIRPMSDAIYRPGKVFRSPSGSIVMQGGVMSDVIKIYHNPRCSKSRGTLELLKSNDADPEVVLYLETPADAATLHELL